MEPMVRLGALIREKRTKAGLSLKKAAKLCGESDSSLSLLERGELKRPVIYRVLTIGKALEIQPAEICHTLGFSDDCRLKNTLQLSDDDVMCVQAFIDYLISRHQNGSDTGGGPASCSD